MEDILPMNERRLKALRQKLRDWEDEIKGNYNKD